MTIYDACMLVILIYGLVQGAWRGMTWQIAPIASLVTGYAVAFPLSSLAAPLFGQPPMNQWVALLVLYVAVSLTVYLAVRSLRTTIEKLKLQEYDRHLGLLLGGVKGLLITLFVTFFLVSMSDSARDYIMPTRTVLVAAVVMDRLHAVMPESVHDRLEPYIHSLDDTLHHHGYRPIAGEIHHVHTNDGDHEQAPAPPFGPPPADQLLADPAGKLESTIEGYLDSKFLGSAIREIAEKANDAVRN